MIINGKYSLDNEHYFSGAFDLNTGICWHCDDDKSTQISDFKEGVYTVEHHKKTKKKVMSVSK